MLEDTGNYYSVNPLPVQLYMFSIKMVVYYTCVDNFIISYLSCFVNVPF